MKKIIGIVCLLVVSNISYGVDIIIRHNRGLFGYDRIDETHNTTTGDNQLNCTDPGRKGCKWSTFTANNDEYENILIHVDKLIGDDRILNGSFQMDGYFVQYDYDLSRDNLVVKIYSHEEALENGFIS